MKSELSCWFRFYRSVTQGAFGAKTANARPETLQRLKVCRLAAGDVMQDEGQTALRKKKKKKKIGSPSDRRVTETMDWMWVQMYIH